MFSTERLSWWSFVPCISYIIDVQYVLIAQQIVKKTPIS